MRHFKTKLTTLTAETIKKSTQSIASTAKSGDRAVIDKALTVLTMAVDVTAAEEERINAVLLLDGKAVCGRTFLVCSPDCDKASLSRLLSA